MKIGLFDIILCTISIILTKMGYGEQDPFKLMNELNNLIEGISDPKLKNFYNNLYNASINNPFNILIYELIAAFIPIFHIFLMIEFIKDIFAKLNYRKED